MESVFTEKRIFSLPKPSKRPPMATMLLAFLGTGLLTLILSIFGAALLNLFGATYTSRGSLIVFVFVTLILSLPFAPWFTVLEKRYLKSQKALDKLRFVLVDTAFTTVMMIFTALFDTAVVIPFTAALLTGIIFSLLELLLNEKSHHSVTR